MLLKNRRLVSMAFMALSGLLVGCGGNGPDLSGDGGGEAAALPITAPPGVEEKVPNQVLVKFAPGAVQSARSEALASVGGRLLERIHTKAMERAGDEVGIQLVHVPGDVDTAVKNLTGLPGVLVAEPNFIYRHNATSNDTYYLNGNLWGMYGDASTPANAYGSQAAEAWANNRTGSSSVYVPIIDEGVMLNHTDLSGQVWLNWFDPLDGRDNDNNGFIDDTFGWDFDRNDRTVYDGAADDHGTHVAGTIGAKGGNGTGVAGVVWNTRMIVCKFLGSRGGTTANAIKAFDYVTDLKVRHGLDIVASNNSWGGGGFSQLLKDAIDRHGAVGIVAVCAAGNSGANNDSSPNYPSSYASSNILAVASITSSGARSSFSNYGQTSVDIGAPGSAVVSTVPARNGTGSSYASYNGTSMSTPHVTGGAALLAASSSARGVALRDAVLSAGVPTPSLAGITSTGDRLNVSGF